MRGRWQGPEATHKNNTKLTFEIGELDPLSHQFYATRNVTFWPIADLVEGFRTVRLLWQR
jgi:hypothetical protein